MYNFVKIRYTTSLFSDDPEMVYRKSIRNTSSLSHPDCATKSLRLNSTIVKRRAQFSTISWMVTLFFVPFLLNFLLLVNDMTWLTCDDRTDSFFGSPEMKTRETQVLF